MTTVRLFRDTFIGEDGGDCLFDAERVNAHLKNLDAISNQSYNKGIDKAIEVVKQSTNGDGTQAWLVNSIGRHIILELESLKKKP